MVENEVLSTTFAELFKERRKYRVTVISHLTCVVSYLSLLNGPACVCVCVCVCVTGPGPEPLC